MFYYTYFNKLIIIKYVDNANACPVEYEIYWRVISRDQQKIFAIRRPIFKLEYFNNHLEYIKATYIF